MSHQMVQSEFLVAVSKFPNILHFKSSLEAIQACFFFHSLILNDVECCTMHTLSLACDSIRLNGCRCDWVTLHRLKINDINGGVSSELCRSKISVPHTKFNGIMMLRHSNRKHRKLDGFSVSIEATALKFTTTKVDTRS